MLKEELKNSLKKYTKGVDKKYLYRDINYDNRGIDYENYIPIYYSFFNSSKSGNVRNDDSNLSITLESWRILFYLASRAIHNKTYIKISIEMIKEDLEYTNNKIIKSLNNLIDNQLIYCEVNGREQKSIKNNKSFIDILILYNNSSDYYNQGYVTLPFDFIYKAILDLDEFSWSILCFLCTRHRYFQVIESIADDTMNRRLIDCGYAYPSQEQISETLGLDRRTVKKYTENLQKKKYIKVTGGEKKTKIKDGKSVIQNNNYKYYINLLNREEYIKYRIIDVYNKMTIEQPERYSLEDRDKSYIKAHSLEDILCNRSELLTKNELIGNSIYLSKRYGNKLLNYHEDYK